jgi:23S rRNA pseudouridine955/2504/2580 synthase
MKKLIVNQKYNNKKLNTFLFDSLPNFSSNLYYQTLRKKDIKLNGKRINKNVVIHEGDEILVYISDERLLNTIKFDTIYEDENILIINKPYDLEVTGANSLTTRCPSEIFQLHF